MGFSYLRNTAIAKIFRELGYMEKLGTGFKTLFESYAKAGLPKPQVIEGENYIKCILPRPSRDHEKRRQLSDDEDRILNLFQVTTELSAGDIINELHIPRSTTSRMLAGLTHKNILRRIGQSKGTRYIMQ